MPPAQTRFYRHALQALQRAGVPFLVGGAAALKVYTGIERDTKDLDLFVRRRDLESSMNALSAAGYPSELVFSHWLAKSYCDRHYVDLIFGSANGVCRVDNAWFQFATRASLFDVPVWVCPIEETIWVKSFIMERERFDGADVAHLLRATADTIDWWRLLERFDEHWPVLLSHLVLFQFIYPDQAHEIPTWLVRTLARRLDGAGGRATSNVCHGTLLSRDQYLPDLQQGLIDGRLLPSGSLTTEEVEAWTNGDPERQAS